MTNSVRISGGKECLHARERDANSGKWNEPTKQATWQTGGLTAVD